MKLCELLDVLPADQRIKIMFPVDRLVCSTEEMSAASFLKDKEENKQFSNREIRLVSLKNSLLTLFL